MALGEAQLLTFGNATLEHVVEHLPDTESNFADQWLRCIGHAIVGIVLYQVCEIVIVAWLQVLKHYSQVLRIRKLSQMGRTQLIVDLRYLGNVLETLTHVLPPLLSHVIHILDEDIAQAQIRRNVTLSDNPHTRMVQELQNKIIALREDFD